MTLQATTSEVPSLLTEEIFSTEIQPADFKPFLQENDLVSEEELKNPLDVFSELEEEEPRLEIPVFAPVAPPLPLQNEEETKEVAIVLTTPAPVATSFSRPATDLSTPALLPAEIEALFEHLAGIMILQDNQGTQETRVILDSPLFAASPFQGAEVVIHEFRSAPKQFNIELVGSPEAVALFQAHANSLAAAFQGGQYNFTLHRIETRLLKTERPLFERKEAISEDREKGQDP